MYIKCDDIKFNERSYPEDFEFENGQYYIKCNDCGLDFMGNKHRFVCKKCKVSDSKIKRRIRKLYRQQKRSDFLKRIGII